MQEPFPVIHPRADPDSRVLFVAAVAMLVFTIFAFAQKVVVVPERLGRYDPLVIAHATAMLGWLALFTIQTGAVRLGAMRVHRTLGALSPLLVVAAVVTGFKTTRRFGDEFDVIHIFLGNMVHLGSFAALYGIGVAAALRHRIDWHRRAMFLASFVTLTPPISRVTQTLGLPNGIAAAVHVGLLCTLPVAWDLATRRRLHPATVTGIALVFAMLAVAALFGTVPPLADWTRALVEGA